MNSSWRDKRFWLRRPRLTNASATLPRKRACCNASSTALSCTRFSASATSRTSPPARTRTGSISGRDRVLGTRPQDLLHGVGQTLAGHRAGLPGERSQRAGDPFVREPEQRYREQHRPDGDDLPLELLVLHRRSQRLRPLGHDPGRAALRHTPERRRLGRGRVRAVDVRVQRIARHRLELFEQRAPIFRRERCEQRPRVVTGRPHTQLGLGLLVHAGQARYLGRDRRGSSRRWRRSPSPRSAFRRRTVARPH